MGKGRGRNRPGWRPSSKYKACPTEVGGIRFASKKEARRYTQLLALQEAGAVRALEVQPRFPLRVGGMLVTTYVADFRYQEAVAGDWREVVEDVKGFRTRVYALKAKLMVACWGIHVRET